LGLSGGDFIEARLTYAVDTGVKPVTGTTDPDGRLRLEVGEFEERVVKIRDGRLKRARFALEREGFEFVDQQTEVTDFFDPDVLRSVYYPEIERLIADLTGASRVIVFDHTLRSGDVAAQEAYRLREPVRVVHNDYTEWSGPQRLRDLLPTEEAEALLNRCRLAVIQVWRPIRAPVLTDPLAICDAQSVEMADLISAERRHPDRVGEIYQLAYNVHQRWFYFPKMTRDEALVFKCYDSLKDGRARFTAHGSFDDPNSPVSKPPRESIEIRTLVLWDPDSETT
jgi:hypothetical protein